MEYEAQGGVREPARGTAKVSIRKRTFLTIGGTLGVMLLLLVAFSQTIVKSGFDKIEDREARLNLGRVRDAFEQQTENLSAKIADWAMWDDAHKYMQDGNVEFEKSSLAIGALLSMKMELFVWRMPDGAIRWGRQFDLAAGKDLPLSPETEAFLTGSTAFFTFKDEADRKQGLIDVPGIGPMFFALQPVVTSEGKGPITGSLLAARTVNEAMIDRLEKLTHLTLAVKSPAAAGADRDFASVIPALRTPADSFVKASSEDEIAGFTRFDDVFGKPLVYVRMTTPRDIHSQGQATILSFLAALAMAGLAFGAAISFMLEKSVISRIIRLDAAIGAVSQSSDVSRRVPVTGSDEIADLAQATNRMLETIAKGQAQIAAKNADLKLILDNAEQGFLNVRVDGGITGERSAIVDQWLRAPAPGTKVWDFLFQDAPALGRVFKMGWEQIGDGFLPFDVAADQLPKRFPIRGAVIEASLRPVTRDGEIQSILVVLSDITAKVAAEKNEAQQKELMQAFRVLMEDRNALPEFFKDGAAMVKELAHQGPRTKQGQMRLVHTLKGNAAQLGIAEFAKLCHELETKIVDGNEALDDADVKTLAQAWEDMRQRFAFLLKDQDGEAAFELGAAEYATLMRLAKATAPHAWIAAHLEALALESLQSRFARMSKAIDGLAQRLGKPGIKVRIEDNGLKIDPAPLQDFWASMVHVLRNAVDHGIEAEDERLTAGKTAHGNITLRSVVTQGHLAIEIHDDGKGIDWMAIREKARGRGLPAASMADLVQALFTDGVSTKEEVNEVSGRGVGTAVIMQSVTKLGGGIEVESEVGRGTCFRFKLPLSALRWFDPAPLAPAVKAA